MNKNVREYLKRFEQLNSEATQIEKKLYNHNSQVAQYIENIKKSSEEKISPIISELSKKRKERDKIGDTLKNQLIVNGDELIREINKHGRLAFRDLVRLIITIDTQDGFLSMDDLKTMIQNNHPSLRNAFKIIIKNNQYECHHKLFCNYKSLPLNEEIKFSDGSSIYDNLVLVPGLDNFNMKVTKMHLSEEGEKKLMLSFAPEELLDESKLLTPINLLKKSILSILEREKPTM